MQSKLASFERVVRRAHRFTDASPGTTHPFDRRNLHPDFPGNVRKLFDDGHYAQATFEAYKFVDEEVQRISGDQDHGTSLMMRVFGGTSPLIKLNPGNTALEEGEQDGFKFLFAGSMLGIRNLRGHKTGVVDDPDVCLDHLSLASMLLRRLDESRLR